MYIYMCNIVVNVYKPRHAFTAFNTTSVAFSTYTHMYTYIHIYGAKIMQKLKHRA
jgi:hypothetical protein